MLEHHIERLRFDRTPDRGADVVIVVTSNPALENYWQSRLEQASDYCIVAGARVLAVSEDWAGGAGNGLGTLYAYQKACEKAKKHWGIDLYELQSGGASIAMYHTAGQGTRLAPLPGCEANNKSAVKLPSLRLSEDHPPSFLTVLEAVIRQTGLYAPKRPGRLSVFWGDQVFIPTLAAPSSSHHADVLATLSPLPSRAEWEERGLSRYGLAALDPITGHAQLLEKIDYTTITALQKSGELSKKCQLGTSLGSFSVSSELLQALLKEFAPELAQRKGKLDSDPHFWMPLSLSEHVYIDIMITKEMSNEEARQHYQRMQTFRDSFIIDHGDKVFSAIDVGAESYWWDYGTIAHYHTNNLKLAGKTAESRAMRSVFGITEPKNHLGNVDIDEGSFLQGCDIQGGTIKNSVLIGVTAENVNVSDCVIINSAFASLTAIRSLLYGVLEPTEWNAHNGLVRADCFTHDSQLPIPMETTLSRDGKSDWEETINGNAFTYAQLYEHNAKITSEQGFSELEKAREHLKKQLKVTH